MQELINKLPSNAFNDFLKDYFAQIEELFNSIIKLITDLIPEEKGADVW